MASMSLPPFLEKLRIIADTSPPDIAGWSLDGKQFHVYNNRFEKEILRRHFRGSRQTFIRQLHFYCFKKLDNKGERWAFFHPKFQRDSPHLIYEIKRKTRTENGGPASKLEVQSVRVEMDNLRKKMQKEIDSLKKELAGVMERLSSDDSCKGQARKRKSSGLTANMEKKKHKSIKEEWKMDVEYPDEMKLLSSSIPFDDGSLALFEEDILSLDDFAPSNVDSGEKSQSQSEAEFINGIKGGYCSEEPFAPSLIAADYFLRAAKSAIPDTDKIPMVKVVMYNSRNEAFNFGSIQFAMFLMKFVEKTRLLSKLNLLHSFDAYQDSESMNLILSRFPSSCPMRELAENSTPYVRRVLLNILEEVPGLPHSSITCEKASQIDESFADRCLLAIQESTDQRRELKGRCFLTFLSFLLEASLLSSEVLKRSHTIPRSSVYEKFFSYFEDDMRTVLSVAHSNLTKMKARSD